jgi:hypothetical protein
MECPNCHANTYKKHEECDCKSCDEMFCSECFYGCRYMCRHAPCSPLARQITEAKWSVAEQILREDPKLESVIVCEITGTKLVRVGDKFKRVFS